MREELEKKLVEKYPNILSEYGGDPRYTCMAWGFECGDGWYSILEELCEKVSKFPGFKFDQVKEKFGELRIYFKCNEEYDEEAQKAVDEAEIKSTTVCETCGEKGSRQNTNGWLTTECHKCKILHNMRLENR